MSNNPFQPSKAEVSARTAAKFLVDVPTGELPAFIRQIPLAALTKIAASLESYAIRATLITAYVQAVSLGYSLADAAGKSTTVSRAVRVALREITDGAPKAAGAEGSKEHGRRKKDDSDKREAKSGGEKRN